MTWAQTEQADTKLTTSSLIPGHQNLRWMKVRVRLLPRWAGESGGMASLEYLSPGLPGNELSPVWTSTGGCLGTCSFPNLPLNIHPDGAHKHFWVQDGFWRLDPVLRVENLGTKRQA